MRLHYFLLIIFTIVDLKIAQPGESHIAATVALVYERFMADKISFMRNAGFPGTLNTIFNPTGTIFNVKGSIPAVPNRTPPGTVVTPIKDNTSQNNISSGSTCVAIDNNGKIVVAGYSQLTIGLLPRQFTIARYNTDGSLDQTFNPTGLQRGVVTTPIIYKGNTLNAEIYGIAIDALNRIVVAGFAGNGLLGNMLAVARYTPDGSLDNTFNPKGTQPNNSLTRLPGVVLTPVGSEPTTSARAMAVKTINSTILIAGYASFPTTPGTGCIILVRYRESGEIDTSLNRSGYSNTNIIVQSGIVSTFVPGYAYAQANAMTIDSTNRIVLAGHANKQPLGNYQSLIVRYVQQTDGSLILDKDFTSQESPGQGMAVLNVGSISEANGVATDALDNIVICGYTFFNGVGQTYVSRYSSKTAALDKTFNARGVRPGLIYVKVGSYSTASGLIMDGCGDMIIAGYSYYPITTQFSTNVFLVYRLNSDGTLDTTFKTDGSLLHTYTYSPPRGGIVLTRIGNSAPEQNGLLINSPRYHFGITMACFKNKIYVAGQSVAQIANTAALPCFAVASYDNA